MILTSMTSGEQHPSDGIADDRGSRRRLRLEAMEAHRRREAEGDAYLKAQLDADEEVVARGPQALVTDRRIFLEWHRLRFPPHSGEWTHDALTYREITRWAVGRTHDYRPLIHLHHPPHGRTEQVPAHNVLWFHWGNAEVEVRHADTTLSFRRSGDPVFVAIHDRLQREGAEQGEPFVVLPPGTREGRMRGSATMLYEVRSPSRRR
jgi:plasmid stability protein